MIFPSRRYRKYSIAILIKFLEYLTRAKYFTRVRVLRDSDFFQEPFPQGYSIIGWYFTQAAEIDDTSALFDDSNTRLEILSRHFPLLHDSSILSG